MTKEQEVQRHTWKFSLGWDKNRNNNSTDVENRTNYFELNGCRE